MGFKPHDSRLNPHILLKILNIKVVYYAQVKTKNWNARIVDRKGNNVVSDALVLRFNAKDLRRVPNRLTTINTSYDLISLSLSTYEIIFPILLRYSRKNSLNYFKRELIAMLLNLTFDLICLNSFALFLGLFFRLFYLC
ncbi:hypothetical protein J5U22_01760 [Saccharolobus shibatae]|uniref:Uncharacterized protein n=1 Tax=Saccharolobus shibatae TaxID=2286 RepID=A0A8F5C1K0_9CREN|nr:hypothetical protein J5U22_01760 [Saccharolobus shibatae]